MKTIAHLNNLAVTCIDANKFRDAVNTLVLALHFTRKHLDHLGSQNGQESVACRLSSQTCCASTCHEEAPLLPSLTGSVHARSARNIIPNSEVPRRDFHKQLFHFSSERKYQYPFLAFHEMDHYSTTYNGSMTFMSKPESHTTLTIQLAAIVIFNCALCHDLLASSVISSATRKVLRDKAITLYEKVVNLYFESNTAFCIEANYSTNSMMDRSGDGLRLPGIVGAQQDMIVMAAVNNLVQLHRESSQETYNYSQLMVTLFQEMQWTDYGSQEIQSQVDAQASVFVSNVVVSWNTELEIAAAAA